ncbi:MAG: threonine synthase [Deltaproteobacteria bacterium]|nr:threonine synthase [Deltaproteobacteria bacterium]
MFFSTNLEVDDVDLADALIQGQAGDKGLFLPREIPPIPQELLAAARDLSYPELAARLLTPYAKGIFSAEVIEQICHDAYDYDVPLEQIDGPRHVLRLDQGPTASFKDFAARFMGRALSRLVRERGTELLILTATSGDTGSAVAQAFHGVEAVQVLVLFPRLEVSDRQRKQMTTLGGNVATLAVDGKFDDCQALVKRAFSDPELTQLKLSSANSINIGRLLPQSVYYVYAAARVADVAAGEQVLFSVPSGNFGDLMGGVLAFHGGLPVKRFVVATNANDEVPQFMDSGVYQKIEPSLVCISNAMNVGHPSNLARLVALYGGRLDETGHLIEVPDMERLRKDFYAVSIDDEETRATIGRVYEQHGAMLEPHGAVGWAGLLRYIERHPAERDQTAVCLETAHPAKFPDEIKAITGRDPELPPSLAGLDQLRERYGDLALDYKEFKAHLLREYK